MKINWKAVREFFIPPTLFESEGYWRITEWLRNDAQNKRIDYRRSSWWDARFPIVLVEIVEDDPHNHLVQGTEGNVWKFPPKTTRKLKGADWSLEHIASNGNAWLLKGDRRRMEEDTMQMMFSI